ncbi:MAG: sulfatase [Myxococcota bacterium]
MTPASPVPTRAALVRLLWRCMALSLWVFVIDSSLSHLFLALSVDTRTAFTLGLWIKALWLGLAFGGLSGLLACLIAWPLLHLSGWNRWMLRLPAWSLGLLLAAGLFGPRLPILGELEGTLLLLLLMVACVVALERGAAWYFRWLETPAPTSSSRLPPSLAEQRMTLFLRGLSWSLLLLCLLLPKLNAHLLPGSPLSARNAPVNMLLGVGGLLLGLLLSVGVERLSRLRARVWMHEGQPRLSSLDRRLLQSLGFGYAASVIWVASFPPGVSVISPPEQPRAAVPMPPDLLLVVVDTLRADRLGFYGSQNPTPQLDQLARESLVFEQQQSASPWTLPAMASLFTGRSPSAHGAVVVTAQDGAARRAMLGVLPVREGLTTLGLELQRHGYRTGLIGTNPCLDRSLGLGRGIEYHALLLRSGLHYSVMGLWLEPWGLRPLDPADTTLSAAELVPHFERFFEQADDRPSALIAHLMDPHWPYHPPERASKEERERLQQSLVGWSAAYDGEVQRVDEALGGLLERLRRKGWLDRSVLALTSDHGEAFGEHGTWYKPEQRPAGVDVYEQRQSLHGHSLFQELLHVPLLVRGPGIEPGRYAAVSRGVDVMPTLLDALGLPIPAGLEGISLLNRNPQPSPEGGSAGGAAAGSSSPLSPPALSESVLLGEERKAWREGPWKLLIAPWRGGLGPVRLYQLERDPLELQEWSVLEPERVQRMRAAMLEQVQQLEAGAGSARTLDPETLEKLRALGYVQDEPSHHP